MDIIYLKDLRIETIVGIHEWERHTKQTVVVDVELAGDVRRAAGTDRIEDTIDYKAVALRLAEYAAESRFCLVETLAERLAGILLEEFGVQWCRLRLNKKAAVREVRDVGVIIERGQRG
jgi:dihydroneopterin aldolase